jgi:hypothetical protein
MARSSVRRLLVFMLLLGFVTMPLVAQADPGLGYRPRYDVSPSVRYGDVPGDHIYRYGYRTQYDSTLVLTPAGHVWAVPTIPSRPSVGITGAPLHGMVCSKGSIGELPAERQQLWIDGTTVGQPGYRCLNFR